MAGFINGLQKCLSIGLIFSAATLFTACSTYKSAGAGSGTALHSPAAEFNYSHDDYLAFLKQAVPYDQEGIRSSAGSYLAGRHAQHDSDWDTATLYLLRTLKHDPDNIMLLQRGFIMALGSGKTEVADALSREIIRLDSNPELSLIYMAVDAMSREDYRAATKFLNAIPDNGVGRYTKPLLKAWSQAGMGNINAAHNALNGLPHNATEFDKALHQLHKGLLHQFVREYDKADAIFRKINLEMLTLRSSFAVAAYYEQTARQDKARAIYNAMRADWDNGSYLDTAIARLDAGRPTSLTMDSPVDGAVAALFDLGNMLYQQEAVESALIYSRMAKHLKPQSDFTSILLGDVLSAHDRLEESVTQYRVVTPESDLYRASRLRAAEMLERSDRTDEALAMLGRLAKDHGESADIQIAIGDLHRRNESFADAVVAYDRAFDIIGDVTEKHWGLLYARGIALERTNQWERAEADLLKALEFRPDHPLVLNYLGYSWAEQGINLDRALDMVERAVILRPDDGYIIDSLGWVLYRMGYFDQAVPLLERASEMLPNDSTINDHLGDAYWQVERKREARFQWHRALHLSDEEHDRDSIQAKLSNGLKMEAHAKKPLKTETAEVETAVE